MKDFKQKIKSYSFWTALSGAVVILIGTLSKAFGLSLNSQIAEDIIMGVCGVLVALGIVCAPIKPDIKEENAEEEQLNDSVSKNKQETLEIVQKDDCADTKNE